MPTAIPGLTRQWIIQTDEPCVAAPVISGDLLLRFDVDSVIATDIYDKSTRWSAPVTSEVLGAATGNGMLYWIDDAFLYAVDPLTGQAKKLSPLKLSGRPHVCGDAIVVMDDQGTTYYSLRLSDGEVAWSLRPTPGQGSPERVTPGPVSSNPDGTLLFLACGYSVLAVSSSSGAVRWTYSPGIHGGSMDSTRAPACGSDTVVAAGLDYDKGLQQLYAIDQATGKQKWMFVEDLPVQGGGRGSWTEAVVCDAAGCCIAGNSLGRLYALDIGTGARRWVQDFGGRPDYVEAPNRPLVDDQDVFITVGNRLCRLDLRTGAVKETCALDTATKFPPCNANATVFASTRLQFQAFSYGAGDALYLSSGAHLEITTTPQHDFALDDEFSIEAWVCTSQGGELVSSHPSRPNGNHFRVNVTPTGRVRFAIVGPDGQTANKYQSVQTRVADSRWHHVAVVHSRGTAVMFVDGHAEQCNAAGLDDLKVVGRQASLTVGAYQPPNSVHHIAPFTGLLLDLRLWSRALTLPLIQDRMTLVLRGDEPGLAGYWRLDSDGPSQLADVVDGANHPTAPILDVAMRRTDKVLDQRLFPYLLADSKPHWSYHGYWSVRGENPMSTRAAATEGVVCYGTSDEIYAVASADGRRMWSIRVPGGCSEPVAAAGMVYFADQTGLHAVSAHEGQVIWTAPLGNSGVLPGGHPPVPLLDGYRIVIVDTSGVVSAYGCSDGAELWSWASPAPPAALCASSDVGADSDVVYCYGSGSLAALKPGSTQGGQANLRWTLPLNNTSPTSAMRALTAARGMLFVVHGDDHSVAAYSEATQAEQWRAALTGLGLGAGAKATGLLPLPDHDVVVVTTDCGAVLGLNFSTGALRWTTALPPGTAPGGSQMVHPAVRSDHAVYCAVGSGVVVALAASTGTIEGVFDSGMPIRSCSIVEAGTVYFGCDHSDHAGHGALHSIVFGENHALRLGLDNFGKATAVSEHVAIEPADAPEFTLLDADQCAVEAWVNTQSGGEVVSVCPSDARRFGLRLWVGGDGSIHFIKYGKPQGQDAWQPIEADTAATSVTDGYWHHIAVSVESATAVRVYLDGVEQTISTPAVAPPAPTAQATGLRIFLGADATQAAAANFYQGLIGEVRVWNSFLAASEVSDRMHVRLRGDEPGLLGYWTFDSAGPHDATRHGLDGSPSSSGNAWLTDLVLDRPSYPFIMTRAALLEPGEAGDADHPARYSLTVMVHKADGSLLADHPVSLWYPRSANAPDTIAIIPPAGTTRVVLNAVPTDQELPSACISARTGADGSLALTIETTDTLHGPMLHLNAGFMHANERFSVSTLISNQSFARPAPPLLTAQSQLMQDYASADGRVDETSDRTTYRTIIMTKESNGSARPNERLEIWARDPVDIQVNGAKASINAYNSATFRTDARGELTVVAEATNLCTPELIVCAGFMHRNDRIVLAPDQELHAKLSGIQGNNFTNAKISNWKPGVPDDQLKAPLLSQPSTAHAEDIAAAIRHVMAATPAASPAIPASAGPFVDMTQLPRAQPRDATRMTRTMGHLNRRASLRVSAVQSSVNGASSGAVSFCLAREGANGPVAITYSNAGGGSPAMVLAAVGLGGAAAGTSAALSLWDIWDDIKDAAEAVYNEIISIAITVGRQIEAAIVYVGGQITKIIHTVADAINIIANFFAQIGLAIKKVIEFLRHLFDWGEILEIKRTLTSLVLEGFGTFQGVLGQALPADVRALGASLRSNLDNVLGANPNVRNAGDFQRTPLAGLLSDVTEGVQSVQSRWLMEKLNQAQFSLELALPAALPVDSHPQDSTQRLLDDLGRILSDVGSVIGDFVALLMSGDKQLADQTAQDFLALFHDIAVACVDLIEVLLLKLLEIAEVSFDILVQTLKTSIDIPVISALYKWVTGGADLTVVDFTCLVVAVPMHLVGTIAGVSAAPQSGVHALSPAAGRSLAGISATDPTSDEPNVDLVSGPLRNWGWITVPIVRGVVEGTYDHLHAAIRGVVPAEQQPDAKEALPVIDCVSAICSALFSFHQAKFRMEMNLIPRYPAIGKFPYLMFGASIVSPLLLIARRMTRSAGGQSCLPESMQTLVGFLRNNVETALMVMGLLGVGLSAYNINQARRDGASSPVLALAVTDLLTALPLATKRLRSVRSPQVFWAYVLFEFLLLGPGVAITEGEGGLFKA